MTDDHESCSYHTSMMFSADIGLRRINYTEKMFLKKGLLLFLKRKLKVNLLLKDFLTPLKKVEIQQDSFSS